MQRLTAKLLLLFALAGSFIPLALAATAEAPHACCIRKAHHCHDSAGAAEESEQLIIRAASCCNHDCCRAVTTSQWAYPQPRMTAISAQKINAQIAESHPDSPSTKFSSSQSTRAPPAC
jgi:hypothetical protein